MESPTLVLRLSKPPPQDLRLRLGILDCLLLVDQLNFQLSYFGFLPPKGYRQFHHSPSQGAKLVKTLYRDRLDSLGQSPLKAGNFVSHRLEPPSVVLYLFSPADSIGIVSHLGILQPFLKVGEPLRPVLVAIGLDYEPGELPSSRPIFSRAAVSSTLKELILEA